MLAERQDASVAYNLRSKSKRTGLPAVTSAIGSDPTVAKPVDDLQKAELKSEVGDRKVGPSLLSVSGDLSRGKQAVGLDIKSYSPKSKPGQQQVRDSETRKAEQGETCWVRKDLPSASKDLSSTSVKTISPSQNPLPQWGTRVVYDDEGRKQLVGCKWGEPDDEPPIGRVIPTAPSLHGSDTDVDDDSDSDEGDSSLLLGNDEGVDVSQQPPLVVDINPSINMAPTNGSATYGAIEVLRD